MSNNISIGFNLELKIFILLLFFATVLSGQSGQQPYSASAFQKSAISWYKAKEGSSLKTDKLFSDQMFKGELCHKENFNLIKSEKDKLKITHLRLQQNYKGIPIEGAEIMVHELDGNVQSFNGKWAEDLNLEKGQALEESEIVSAVLKAYPAEKYLWEDQGAEDMLCHISKCERTTFYPDPDLVWYTANRKEIFTDLSLCYKLEVQAEQPLFSYMVYVDAISGKVVDSYDQIHHHHDVPGTAQTKYSGEQTIIADSTEDGNYRLRESGRGEGIITLDMKGGLLFGDAEDFLDDDNYWDNVNEKFDEVATDCHWAAEMTFDYLLEKHDYYGVDNEGMGYVSYVHYDSNVVNAFWNGSWASFGDGSVNGGWTPLTTIDVVAHEFVHGITQHTAGLVYRDESGALNESFSDIFGAAVEFWAIPDSADWRMAEDAQEGRIGFRNMAMPKERQHPDTYKGLNWYVGDEDNGGVHSNSGVQNFWFYLLTDGGSGVNDFDHEYVIEGLGLDKSSSIAIRNLRYYLSRESNYYDAREGSLKAAADLYGACSFEYIQTAKAWEAVGLGNAIQEFDFKLLEITSPVGDVCGLTDAEFPSLLLQYNACDSILELGTEIPICFQVDEWPIVHDTIILIEDLNGGDQLLHQSSKTISGLETFEEHRLRAWINLENDPFIQNDLLEVVVKNEIEQNVDFGLQEISDPISACFKNEDFVRLDLVFEGCDSIVAGTEITLHYRFDEEEMVSESYVLEKNLYSAESFEYQFNTAIDFSSSRGRKDLTAWISYSEDFLVENDSLPAIKVSNPLLVSEGDLITFEYQDASLDSIYTISNRGSSIFTNFQNSTDGFFALQMTGGDFERYRSDLRIPNDLTIWTTNESLQALTCICVDASEMEQVFLSFDLRQTFSIYYEANFGRDRREASSMRVLADGVQISETFNPTTYAGDPFVNHNFDLTEHAGTSFEVCFETRNFLSPEFDGIGVGDNTYLDNIWIGSEFISSVDVNSSSNNFDLFPNPATNILSISFSEDGLKNVDLEIINLFGQTIFSESVNLYGNNSTHQLSIDALEKGAYYLKVRDGNTISSAKFLKL